MVSEVQHAGAPPVSRAKRRRDMIAVNIGNAMEWFDWNIYAIFAPFFAAQFFRTDDPVASLLSTLAVFGAGFIMRPVGGWLFGRLGDARGRRFSLTLAVALAAVGSLIIAIAPTFDVIGPLAAAVLLVARLIQGLSHGGETGNAFTYLAEVAPTGHRGLWASTPWVGVGIGTIGATGLGALLTSVLSDEQMTDFGWRIPFAVAAVLGVYALWIRYGMKETSQFEAEAKKGPAPSLAASFRRIASYWPQILRITGLTIGGVTVFYTWLIFAPGYATRAFGIDATVALVIGIVAQALFIVASVAMGAWSDRIGRRPVFLVFSIGFAIAAFLLDFVLSDNPWTFLLAMCAAAVLMAANCGPIGALFAELVPTRDRATVIGVGYATSGAIFGGTAPYLNTWLESIGHHWIYTLYLVILCVITTIVVIRLPETNKTELK